MKKVVVSVINDLVTDQRVHKSCTTWVSMGVEVLLIGRKLPNSPPMDKRDYKTKRMRLLFTKGALFYAEYNFRLWLLLLFRRMDLLVSNDLDTLLANYMISRLKSKSLIYDSHEYFTEVPELEGRSAKKVWERIEAWIFPKLKDIITVNDSIAGLYKQKYDKELTVVRNIPMRPANVQSITKNKLGIDEDTKIIILQGAGINVDRGAEEAVEAMKEVEGAILLIVGGGDVITQLKEMASNDVLSSKVMFIDRQPIERLYGYTSLADIGLSLDKDTNLNYRFSLPNKVFDYIQCGVPVLASDLPEVKKIVLNYNIGQIVEEHTSSKIAQSVNQMLDEDFKKLHAEDLKKAAKELVWDNEVRVLKKIYQKYL